MRSGEAQLRLTFERLRATRRKALIPFVMGGDPNLPMTAQLLLALEEAGADLIEVGIPFSDPLADGPVIQEASARALAHGATPARVLSAIASVRRRLHVPLVCLSYWNPLLQFGSRSRASSTRQSRGGRRVGLPAAMLAASLDRARDAILPRTDGRARHEVSGVERAAQAGRDGADESLRAFVRLATASGVAGVIVPDLPVEEATALRAVAIRERFATIFLAAPTSPPERLRMIARASEGFIYYVSVTGTTGARRTLPEALRHGVRQLKGVTTKPVCVGFGISTPAQGAAVARMADGVIVGSALVQAIARARGNTGKLRSARRFLGRMRRAI